MIEWKARGSSNMDAVNQKQAADLKQLETYLDEIEDNMLDLEGCLVDLLAMESDIRGRRTVMLENIAMAEVHGDAAQQQSLRSKVGKLESQLSTITDKKLKVQEELDALQHERDAITR